MMEWIKFDERPPKKRGAYLVWQPEYDAALGTGKVEARYAVLTWTGKRFFSSFPVSHWAVLPEKPKP